MRPSSPCSISTAPIRASRTAAARLRSVPWTTKSLSVVRTTRVCSQLHTARTATAAPTTWSATPAIEAGQPIAIRPMPTAARPNARRNGSASTTAWRRSSRQTRSHPEVTMRLPLSATGEKSLVMAATTKRIALATSSSPPPRRRQRASGSRGERRGDRRLELGEPERLDEIGNRRERLRRRARRLDARADDGEIPEPATKPGRRSQAVRRSRLEDHQLGRVVAGQLALADRVVPSPPDNSREEDPDVGVRFVNQDPCHSPSFGGPGSKGGFGPV